MNYKISRRLNQSEIQSLILHRDGLILVLNKPTGLPVHNAGGSNHNLEQYFSHLQFGLPNPPILAHRLDLGTSGCLVLARNLYAAQRMQALFTQGEVQKTYIAHVFGEVAEDHGHINVPLSKLSELKKHWWMKADPKGKISAHTEYKVLRRGQGFTELLLIPHTGRTHQLRVHCAHLGHPIVGDYIYGPDAAKQKQTNLHLHSRSIEFKLYPRKAPLYFEAPLPEHMKNFELRR
jgi:tRNA pseudouridine32 synthase/23S rRNA pseudouridine746 synthase